MSPNQPVPIPQAFELALQFQQAGRLPEAEAIYRQILQVAPTHAGAWQYLGVIAHQRGNYEEAAALISRALEIDPHNVGALVNLGTVYRSIGRLEEAVHSFHAAIRIDPHLPQPYHNLANTLKDLGRLNEAIGAYRQALSVNARIPEIHYALGNALREIGQFADAESAFRSALQLRPAFPQAWNHLGVTLSAQGRNSEAVAVYQQALALDPNFFEAHNNLGSAFNRLNKAEAAIASFRRAIQLHPDSPEAWRNLGVALQKDANSLDEALAACQRAIQLKPDVPEAYYSLGNALASRGLFAEATAAFVRAIEFNPAYANAYNNLGNVLRVQGRSRDAIAAYSQALAADPGYWEAYNNLGNARKDQGELDEALAAYRAALALRPDQAELRQNLIYTSLFHPDCPDTQIAEEQSRWNEQVRASLRGLEARYTTDCNPERRLRIGYVSPDFREHVVGRNLLPLFSNHDHRHFEIVCYSGTALPDSLTTRLRSHADQWRDTANLGDEALATLIQEDAIDILVDLSQHMSGNRLPMFARQPAPVQASFAGYPATTGLETIKYRISDRHLEKEGEPGNNTSLRLPGEEVFLLDSFWCYAPINTEIPITALPACNSGHITFGSFNHFGKINQRVLDLWARVLAGIPESRLCLLTGLGDHRARTQDFFARQGIDPRRIEFFSHQPHADYLRLYGQLDIALDSFPYGGHTTSLDALWMGVPVVSLRGEHSVSRAGWSQLSNLGLTELVASTEDQYVEIATQLAKDIPKLQRLRTTLRGRMQESVLMNASHFARQIEASYRTMWRQWCSSHAS